MSPGDDCKITIVLNLTEIAFEDLTTSVVNILENRGLTFKYGSKLSFNLHY